DLLAQHGARVICGRLCLRRRLRLARRFAFLRWRHRLPDQRRRRVASRLHHLLGELAHLAALEQRIELSAIGFRRPLLLRPSVLRLPRAGPRRRTAWLVAHLVQLAPRLFGPISSISLAHLRASANLSTDSPARGVAATLGGPW